MPSRCIWRTCGMKRTRFHDRSSVRMKTTFGRGRCCGCAAGRADGTTEPTPTTAASSMRAARRTAIRVVRPQLDLSPLVRGGMRRIHLISSLAVAAASAILFAGMAWGANLGGTNHRDFINGTPDADVINARGGSDVVRARGGNDTVRLGRGFDVVLLGAGDDSATGGAGADRIN